MSVSSVDGGIPHHPHHHLLLLHLRRLFGGMVLRVFAEEPLYEIYCVFHEGSQVSDPLRLRSLSSPPVSLFPYISISIYLYLYLSIYIYSFYIYISLYSSLSLCLFLVLSVSSCLSFRSPVFALPVIVFSE